MGSTMWRVVKQRNGKDQISSTDQPATAVAKDPREHVTGRAIAVWLAALITYIVAIVGRTSLPYQRLPTRAVHRRAGWRLRPGADSDGHHH